MKERGHTVNMHYTNFSLLIQFYLLFSMSLHTHKNLYEVFVIYYMIFINSFFFNICCTLSLKYQYHFTSSYHIFHLSPKVEG